MSRCYLICAALMLSTGVAWADKEAEEFNLFRGHWRITELVEDGRVVAPDAIKNWFPSGGRVEFVDNSILFTSRLDGKKQAEMLSIDPTAYPKTISVSTRDKTKGWGIYQFDKGRLVICVTDPAVAAKPTDFSAKSGSHRMLMILERDGDEPAPSGQNAPVKRPVVTPQPVVVAQPVVPAPAPSPATALVLTDAQVRAMLLGTWKFNDGIGVLNVTVQPDGSYFSTREVQYATTFHSVFTTAPVSNGVWSVSQGQLTFRINASVYANRVNQAVPLVVRSISPSDLIYVDYLGRMGRAIKAH